MSMPAPISQYGSVLPRRSVPVEVCGGWKPTLPGVPGDQYGLLNFPRLDRVPPPFHGPTSPTGTPLADPPGAWTSTHCPIKLLSGSATKTSLEGLRPYDVVGFSLVSPGCPRPSRVPLTEYHGDQTTCPRSETMSQFPYSGNKFT